MKRSSTTYPIKRILQRCLSTYLTLFAAGCASTSNSIAPEALAEIQAGMPASELIAILGLPKSIETHPDHPQVEIWTYQREILKVELEHDSATVTEYIDSFGKPASTSTSSMRPEVTEIKKSLTFLIAEGKVVAWRAFDGRGDDK